MKWNHYCFTFDNTTLKWQIFKNGEIHETSHFINNDGIIEGNGAYIIGIIPNFKCVKVQ